MELLQLEYFMKVAKEQHITKVAEQLHISQSSLSQTMSRLEKELGTKLFDRVGKRIVLNERGRVFQDGVQKAFKELRVSKTTVTSMADHYVGHLNIGVFISPSMVMECIAGYAAANPYVNFTVTTQLNLRSSYNLEDFDFHFYFESPLFKNYSGITLVEDAYYAILPKSSPLAERESLQLSDLANEEFASYSVSQEDGVLEPPIRGMQAMGINPKVCYRTDSTIAKQIILENGLAAGLVSKVSLRDYKPTGKFVIIPVEDLPKPLRVQFGWKIGSQLSPAAESFREYAMRFFNVWTDAAITL